MIIPIETKEFMAKTGLSCAGAKKALAAKRWKKQPLIVNKHKNPNGGRDLYKVLWDTEANTPATGESHEKNNSGTVQTAEPDSTPTPTNLGEQCYIY